MGYFDTFKARTKAKAREIQAKATARKGRMPKRMEASTPKVSSPGDGDGGIRSVETGDGLERGNNMPKALPGKVAKE